MSTAPRSLPRAPFAAMVAYALRVSAPPGRRWLLALPVSAAGLFGAISSAAPGDPAANFRTAAALGIFFLVLPLTCLVLGDAVLGAEVRAGTFAVTWLAPVPVAAVSLARWLGGWVLAVAVLAPAGLVGCLAAGQPGAVPAMVGAIAAGAAAYIAVFVLFGAVARRAAAWSIAYVVIVERLLAGALSSIAQLSPSWLAWTAFDDLTPQLVEYRMIRSGIPYGWGAAGRLGLLGAVALALATWRLRRIVLTGPAE